MLEAMQHEIILAEEWTKADYGLTAVLKPQMQRCWVSFRPEVGFDLVLEMGTMGTV